MTIARRTTGRTSSNFRNVGATFTLKTTPLNNVDKYFLATNKNLDVKAAASCTFEQRYIIFERRISVYPP